MKSFDELRKICEHNSRILERVVDDFLIDYAARHHNLEKKMSQQFGKYRHVYSKFQKGWVEMLKSQFIVHRVFKEAGLLEKFMKYPALERFKGEEREYLEQVMKLPWRFSFSVIIEEPGKDFFLMKDVFSGVEFMLFSPGVGQMKDSGNPILWFNLIGFNGSCWQSFGPIGAYNSFEPEDIYFFATELNPEIEDEAEVMANIEENPIPFMMLLAGANYPRTFHKGDQLIYLMAEHDLKVLDTVKLKKSFKSEYDNGVYRFTHEEIGEQPDFGTAYYDENLQLILFTAMTDSGFQDLVKDVNAYGYDFPDTPFFRVNLTMLTTAKEILKKEIVLNEYEELFREEPDEENHELMDGMNAFMALVLPDINAGIMPDIEAAARKAGVPMDTARDMVNMVRGKLDEMPGAGADPDVVEREEAARFREIYLLADEIRDMEPWNRMHENDLFGVKIPGSDRIYFISVMGTSGEFFGLAFYKGYKGFSQFLQFHENANVMPPETILTIPHLMLSFADREELEKEHLATIKQSGVRFRGKGKWPRLDDRDPGFLSVFPGGEVLSDLQVLLEQVANVITTVEGEAGSLFMEGGHDDAFMIRTPSGSAGRVKWKNEYERIEPGKGTINYKMSYSRESCAKVSKLKESTAVVQVDLVMLPSPVKDQRGKGYYPFILLLVDKEQGMVAGMEMLSPDPDLHSLHESLPQILLEKIVELGYRPKEIEIRSELLLGLVQGAMKEAWVTPVQVKYMPQMDDAVNSLIDHME